MVLTACELFFKDYYSLRYTHSEFKTL